PGSTFKPAMAIAALESGTVDSTTTFRCTGTYKYLDQTFSCLSAHGSLNVVRAIQHSCNTYFYNVADAMGIELMNEYAADFGLGQRTGVEIPEALGVLASPSYKESLGTVWNPGDTIQAAIGQSDHLFTPLQLASYSATLANGGTRYQSRLVNQVMSYDYSEIITQYQPTVLDEVVISQTSLDLVKEGMNRVGTVGTLSSAFRGLNFEVSAKTGTSQVKGSDGQNRNNGFLISFAPSDDPELSIASVIELAGSGTSTADLTRRILDYYYTETTSDSIPQDYGTLLS
ncbi:MAG: penicillin-binding protein A, partial [Clostridiales bacterium]|nr:penicillin-binding protein A [Clostridiales bacterium]